MSDQSTDSPLVGYINIKITEDGISLDTEFTPEEFNFYLDMVKYRLFANLFENTEAVEDEGL